MAIRLTFLALVLVSGCSTTNPYKSFYNPYFADDVTTLENVELLVDGEEPTLYTSSKLQEDILLLTSKGYIPIGGLTFSSTSGPNEKQALQQAKATKAKIVLIGSERAGTRTSSYTNFFTGSTTTRHQGTIGSQTYSGTSTTRNKPTTTTTRYAQYAHHAIYFIKNTKRYRFGLQMNDLSQEVRNGLKRNTGAVVSVVMERSPAFNADIVLNDIIVAVDGTKVLNAEHCAELMSSVPHENQSAVLTVLRYGIPTDVSVTF